MLHQPVFNLPTCIFYEFFCGGHKRYQTRKNCPTTSTARFLQIFRIFITTQKFVNYFLRSFCALQLILREYGNVNLNTCIRVTQNIKFRNVHIKSTYLVVFEPSLCIYVIIIQTKFSSFPAKDRSTSYDKNEIIQKCNL